jgi:glucose-6-phosphate isomerase
MTQLANPTSAGPQDLWQRFCALLWHDEALGFWLDVSRMGIDTPLLEELRPRFGPLLAAYASVGP